MTASLLPYQDEGIFIAAVEGAIGAGKTTFIEHVFTRQNIAAYFAKQAAALPVAVHVEIVDEPVQMWQDSGAFREFNLDPKKNAGQFQQYTFSTRIGKFAVGYKRALHAIRSGKAKRAYIVVERSWLTDCHVFKRALTESGAINATQSRMYDESFEAWDALVGGRQPDVILYLDVPKDKRVDVFMSRIAARNRDNETVPRDYEQKLCELHDAIYGGLYFGRIPVVKVDALVDFTSDSPAARALAETVLRQICA